MAGKSRREAKKWKGNWTSNSTSRRVRMISEPEEKAQSTISAVLTKPTSTPSGPRAWTRSRVNRNGTISGVGMRRPYCRQKRNRRWTSFHRKSSKKMKSNTRKRSRIWTHKKLHNLDSIDALCGVHEHKKEAFAAELNSWKDLLTLQKYPWITFGSKLFWTWPISTQTKGHD